jgi:creatinine amidohydrolase
MARDRDRRLLDELTWPEVRDAAARDAGVIVPVGATEQHGPHLPLSTDALLATELALAVAGPLDLYVAPPLAYGYRSRPLSGGGQSFPGTISLGARTLMALLEDVLTGLVHSGFDRLAVLSWHFENANFVYEAAWLAHERCQPSGARIMVVEAPFAELSESAMEALFGGEFPGWDVEHAAVLETSLMMHLRPELVRFERAVDDRAARHPFYDVVPAPSDFVPRSGTLWKATRARAEKGAVAWPEIVASMRDAIAIDLPVRGPAERSYPLRDGAGSEAALDAGAGPRGPGPA